MTLDPRIARTRNALHEALHRLLEENSFDKISVQHIAEAAGVNRATFYDHYDDKFRLLECMVARRFQQLLHRRGVVFDGSCAGALNALVSGVRDYLLEAKRLDPYTESAMIVVLRQLLLEGLKRHPPAAPLTAEMLAGAAAGAIYGAVKDWPATSSEDLVATVARLVTSMMFPA